MILKMKDNQNIEKHFKRLLEKFQAVDCTASELKELEQLVQDESSASEIENTMYVELKEEDYQELVAFDKAKLSRRLEYKINERIVDPEPVIRKLPRFYRLSSVAAILVLLIVVSGLATYFVSERQAVEQQPISYSEIVAPLGAKTQVVLPDGTVVWLNAGSKLTYSTNFNMSSRLVYLEGEGYFQVAKNKEKPFVVDAFGFLVEGGETEFNVKAYQDDPTIEAVLVEGKVWLNHRTETITSDVSLGRKYKATFYKQSNVTALSHGRQPRLVISPNVDPKPIISWKNDRRIPLKSESLDNMLIKPGKDLVIWSDLNRKEFLRYGKTGWMKKLNPDFS
ncbi:FecR family protein [uncultured Sunxiuqinia sp.]|uniref:FecR family protein n=1 Tax=uncultured Sunxiuqinia sp. TaxID=1573825 RepID=UPI003748F9F5